MHQFQHWFSEATVPIRRGWRIATTLRAKGHWKLDYVDAIAFMLAAAIIPASRFWYRTPWSLPSRGAATFADVWEKWAASGLTIIGVAATIAVLCYIGSRHLPIKQALRPDHFGKGIAVAFGSVLLVTGQASILCGLVYAYLDWSDLVPPVIFPPVFMVFLGLIGWLTGEQVLRFALNENVGSVPDCPECARMQAALDRATDVMQGMRAENAQLRQRLEE